MIDAHDERSFGPSVNEIFGSFVWKHLKCLKIRSMHATETDLVDFFHRHSNSIKDIFLARMTLTEGHWGDAFLQMQGFLYPLNELAFGDSLISLPGMTKINMERSGMWIRKMLDTMFCGSAECRDINRARLDRVFEEALSRLHE